MKQVLYEALSPLPGLGNWVINSDGWLLENNGDHRSLSRLWANRSYPPGSTE